MRILGIDPGIGRCGVAILETPKSKSGKPDILLVDCLTTDPKLSHPQRLAQLKEQLVALVRKYRPNEVAIESLWFAKNVKTALMVAEARGVVLLLAAEKRLPVFEYKPLEIKMVLTGYGKADKKQIQKMLKLYLEGKTIVQDDAADAVAIAICHLMTNRKLKSQNSNLKSTI